MTTENPVPVKNLLLQETNTLVNAALKKAKIDPKIKMQGFGPALTKVVYGVLKNGTEEQKAAVTVDSIAKLAEYSLGKTSELYTDEVKPFQFLVDLGLFRNDARNVIGKQALLSDLRSVRREWALSKSLPAEVRVAPKPRVLTGSAKTMSDLAKEVEVVVPITEDLEKPGHEQELTRVQSLRGALFSLGYIDGNTHLKAEDLRNLKDNLTTEEVVDLAKLRRNYGRVADLRDVGAAKVELAAYREKYAENLRRTAKKAPAKVAAAPEVNI